MNTNDSSTKLTNAKSGTESPATTAVLTANPADETPMASDPAMALRPSEVVSKSKYNALKTGVFAKNCVLPWEDPAEHEAMLQAYLDELFPEGMMEEDLVAQVVQLEWIKRRVTKALIMPFVTDPFRGDMVKTGIKGWEAIEDYVRDQRQLNTPSNSKLDLDKHDKKKYDELVKSLAASTGSSPEIIIAKTAQLVSELSGDQTKPGSQEDAIFDRVLRPADLDQYLKQIGTLDARIDKTMARLVSTKEYKMRYKKHLAIDQSVGKAA